ncbi:unnamed protein product [Adineta steineri]|uniref:DDX60-like winged helix domain-containing protein n=1 Tax=Adineta steineri TaxID=433720 RepID=A0A814NCM9_9BILA|nr:unnamed protein product [Adineta steineri]CAF4115213.1 unnamed protein product [Adineta steineri]
MPTKTITFVKNSIYFDALRYRQSLDRASHHGFEIPLSKIRHLIILVISNIHAHFLTSFVFLMGLFHLCSNTKDSNDAINRSLIALHCPFLTQSPVKHIFIYLFTLDFFYRLDLINGQGDSIGLAGLLSHLHYFEPTDLLLVYLIQN